MVDGRVGAFVGASGHISSGKQEELGGSKLMFLY
jgi:hypothetical protein